MKSLPSDAFMCRRKALTCERWLPNSFALMSYLVINSNTEDKQQALSS